MLDELRRANPTLPVFFAGPTAIEPRDLPPPAPGLHLEMESAWPSFQRVDRLAARRIESLRELGFASSGGEALAIIVWNNLLFAKPGETVWQIMERDRQVSDAAARHSALLDTLASMLAELSQKTRPPEVKVRSRGEKALVTAVKASDASPVFAAVEIAKTPVEAETLARWAKNAPEALGGPQTQRALEVMRRNFAMMAARTNRTDLWSEQMLDRELGPNAKG